MQSIVPDLLVQVIAVVSGAVITVGVPLILAKLNKISKIYTTVFGVEDVESMGGLVSVVESNTDEIDSMVDTVEDNTEKLEGVSERIDKLEQTCRERDN